MRVMMFVTEDWYLCSHRLPIVRAAVASGDDVLVVTHVSQHGDVIRSTGATVKAIPLLRQSANPFRELRTVLAVMRIAFQFKPDVIHNVALKPVIYGSFTGWLLHVPHVVNAMAGMGALAIEEPNFGRRLLRRAISMALRRPGSTTIVQNPDDSETIERWGVPTHRIVLVPGSGIDLKRFAASEPPSSEQVRVLFVGRLLRQKGIFELHRAAEMLRATTPSVRVQMLGSRDSQNPACLDEATLNRWKADGVIDMLGHQDDVEPYVRDAHVIALPSLGGEGIPKALLEAAAVGRPMVTTQVPGCREVVVHGVNGLLVAPGDWEGLAAAIAELARDPAVRATMGKASRCKAERDFSEDVVSAATLSVYRAGARAHG